MEWRDLSAGYLPGTHLGSHKKFEYLTLGA